MANDSRGFQPVADGEPETLPLSAMRSHGLLWLINKAVFHPRGYALAFDMDDDGAVMGWVMLGDGTQPWQYGRLGDGTEIDDEQFALVEAFLNSLRPRLEGRA